MLLKILGLYSVPFLFLGGVLWVLAWFPQLAESPRRLLRVALVRLNGRRRTGRPMSNACDGTSNQDWTSKPSCNHGAVGAMGVQLPVPRDPSCHGFCQAYESSEGPHCPPDGPCACCQEATQ